MKFSDKLEPCRMRSGYYASDPRSPYGAFLIQGPCGAKLTILACDGDTDGAAGWEHVSVSTERRIPNWIEMCFVKDLFWSDEECVVQFHPPRSEYVNNHERALHLWRWAKGEFPRPPSICVGIKEASRKQRDEQRLNKNDPDWMFDELMTWPAK